MSGPSNGLGQAPGCRKHRRGHLLLYRKIITMLAITQAFS